MRHEECFKMPNLPKLKRIRGDIIELYNIITSKEDSDVILKLNTIPVAFTRGNKYKTRQDHVNDVRYDLHKFPFSDRVRILWNSLPDIVKTEPVNSFKERLDKFWNDQEVKFITYLKLYHCLVYCCCCCCCPSRMMMTVRSELGLERYQERHPISNTQ